MGNRQGHNPERIVQHVLEVSPNSPGSHAQIVPFFDTIISANGIDLVSDDNSFKNILKENVNKEIQLYIYNTRTKKYRETSLVPNDKWGGEGLCGLYVRADYMNHMLEYVWHILVVQYGSPAFESGLESDIDYIVGSPEMIFFHHESLYSLIESKIDKELKLYVYSKKTDSVRSVILKPRYGWRNDDKTKKKDGFLGCDIAYGLNHRLPLLTDEGRSSLNENSDGEKEKMVPLFEVEDGQSPILKSKSQSKISSPRSNHSTPLRPIIAMPHVHTPKTPPPSLIFDSVDNIQSSPLPLELLDSFD